MMAPYLREFFVCNAFSENKDKSHRTRIGSCRSLNKWLEEKARYIEFKAVQ